MQVWTPTSNGIYGPVEVLALEKDACAGTIVLFMGGLKIRYSVDKVNSKGFSHFNDDELRAVDFFVDEGFRVLVLRYGQIFRWGDRWVDNVCAWVRRIFGKPKTFLVGHSAGAILALSQLNAQKPSITNIALLSTPHLPPIKRKKFMKYNVFLIHGVLDKPAHETHCKIFQLLEPNPNAGPLHVILNVGHDVWSSTVTLDALKQWMDEAS